MRGSKSESFGSAFSTRPRYAAARAVSVIGGLRFGMTTARANTRAVWEARSRGRRRREGAGERHGARKRQLREERSEHALPIELRAFASGRGALSDQHELAALTVGVLAEPTRRFA